MHSSTSYSTPIPHPKPVPPDTYQSSLGFNEWSVLTIHFVVEAAGVAEIVAGAVPPPQRRGRGSAVHTLSPF